MPQSKVDSYMAKVVAQAVPLDCRQEVAKALSLIDAAHLSDGKALQLLALRRYLRMERKHAHSVHSHWAWTPEQAKALSTSGLAKVLMEEAAKVQKAFARSNSGYVLAMSPIRSLQRQVRRWNQNGTVQRAAKGLYEEMTKELSNEHYPEPLPTATSVAAFATVLRGARVSPEPSSAAPGTSDHGQLRAVDFVVLRGGTLIAGTETAHIQGRWKADGWERKLIAATAGTKLVGPLKMPYEPWHWRLA